MAIRLKISVERYQIFAPGERVTPSSGRSELDHGKTYVITRCIEPIMPGDGATAFVEGRPTGVSTEYLRSLDQPYRDDPTDAADAVIDIGEMYAAADHVAEALTEAIEDAGLDLVGILNRAYAFLDAYGLVDHFHSYVARQAAHQAEQSASNRNASSDGTPGSPEH